VAAKLEVEVVEEVVQDVEVEVVMDQVVGVAGEDGMVVLVQVGPAAEMEVPASGNKDNYYSMGYIGPILL
jgi:hypothetical protein